MKKTYTTSKVFRIINDQLKTQDLLPRNLEYGIPDHQPVEIRDTSFELLPELTFGGSEGLYLDFYLRGDIGTGNGRYHVGCYKMLETDKDTYLEMCRLQAEFVFAFEDFYQEAYDDMLHVGYHVSLRTKEGREHYAFFTHDHDLEPVRERARILLSREWFRPFDLHAFIFLNDNGEKVAEVWKEKISDPA